MLKLKAKKTKRYAQSSPSLPQVLLIKDAVYSCPDHISKDLLDRVIELGEGEIVEDDIEKPESKMKPIEVAPIEIEKPTERKAGTRKSR